jgi:glycosyltransferase involved in cell wall biosynthesis
VKIALLSDCYLPRLGGIEVQVHDLATRLMGRGHEVVVFTATPGSHGERGGFVDEVDGVEVHRLALRLPFELPVNPMAPRALRERLAGGSFDVAHIQMGVVSPFAFDCTRVTTGLGLPTAMTWHCMVGRLEPVMRAAGYVRGWAGAGVAMSAVSAVAAEPLGRLIGADAEVSVLPNGIDIESWSLASGAPAPAARSGAEADLAADSGSGPGVQVVRVVSAMRLAARKRPLTLLSILARVRALVPATTRIQLDIFGEGPDRGRMERFVAAHEMGDWVSLPGRVTREELRGRYASSDIFVAPAPLESFGIAALEARTVGLPVVGRRGSGVGEFVKDGVNGLLAIDDDALADCLARLVTDDALRGSMKAYNRGTPPEQSWERVLDGAEAEYRRATAMAAARVAGRAVSGATS